MLIAGRNGMVGGKHYTAKDYVQDGLIAMWDGIENAGWGVHDGNARYITDLIGGEQLSLADETYCGHDCIVCNSGEINDRKSRSAAVCSAQYPSTRQIEISIKLTSMWTASNSAAQGYRSFQYFINAGTPYSNAGTRGRQIYCPLDSDGTAYKRILLVRDPSDPYEKRGFDGFYQYFNTRCSISASVVGDDAYINGNYVQINTSGRNQSSAYWRNTFIGGISGEVMCIRFYSRALSADEIAHNYEIDRIRFNLDGGGGYSVVLLFFKATSQSNTNAASLRWKEAA